MMTALAFTGWAAAAFLAGWLLRGRAKPARRSPARTRKPAPPDPDAVRRAEQARRAWSNLLAYDGTAQEE